MQTSEAFAFWRGRAAEWTSFRACAEAKNVELARTSGAYAPFRTPIARVSAQDSRTQAPLFAYFFWQDRKSRSAKQGQFQICRRVSLQRETLNMQRVDVGIDPYGCGAHGKSGGARGSRPTFNPSVSLAAASSLSTREPLRASRAKAPPFGGENSVQMRRISEYYFGV